MPILQHHQPVSSTEPRLVVDNTLAPGRHRFALVVVDEQGRTSAPDICEVIVLPAGQVVPASPAPKELKP